MLGNVIGATKGDADAARTSSTTAGPSSRAELIESIRADYAQNYFVTGTGEMAGYDPQCVFADPFVSFTGLQRFKANVSNLGGLMRDIKLDVFEFTESEAGDQVTTRWRFSCVLTFPPWRPRLSAGGSTVHVLDPRTHRVTKHIENWEVEPGRVLKQLLVPDAKIPVTKWEQFAMLVNRGDLQGLGLFFSPSILKYSAVLIGGSMLWRAGSGNQPAVSDLADLALFHTAGVCLAVEANKLVGGFSRAEM